MAKIEQLEEGKKLHVELEGGEVFDGDPLEVTRKLAESQENTKKWGRTAHDELKTLKDKKVEPPAANPNLPAATGEEAQLRKYLLDQTAQALGYKDGEEYKADLIKAKGVTEKIANQSVAADFISQCPDFPNNDASIEALKTKMEKMGYDYTPQSMIAAHMLCLREEAYKPLSLQEQNQTWANNMNSANRTGAPPMIRSNSNEQSQTIDLWNEDPQKQRERIIREQLAGRQ